MFVAQHETVYGSIDDQLRDIGRVRVPAPHNGDSLGISLGMQLNLSPEAIRAAADQESQAHPELYNHCEAPDDCLTEQTKKNDELKQDDKTLILSMLSKGLNSHIVVIADGHRVHYPHDKTEITANTTVIVQDGDNYNGTTLCREGMQACNLHATYKATMIPQSTIQCDPVRLIQCIDQLSAKTIQLFIKKQ